MPIPQSYQDMLDALNAVGPSVQPMAPQLGQPTPAAPQTLDQVNAQPVPTFQPPPNPAMPIHHGFLSRVGTALNGIGSQGISDATASLLTPHDLHQAKSAAWLALSNSLLNPQYDARGFRQSTLGSIASGLQNSRAASQESAGGALQAAQYATGVQQQKALTTGRATLAQQFAFNPQDTQNEQLRKLDGLAAGLVGLGDYHGATAAAAAARSLREGTGASTGSQNKRLVNMGDRFVWADPVTKQVTELDGKPVTDGKIKETAFHAAETWAARNTADLNASTHRDSAFQTQFVKPFTKTATSFASWESALPSALPSKEYPQGNPAATKPIITAFVGAMEPNVQLRYATLQYLSDINPSWAGMARKWIQTGEYGTIPPDMLQAMNQVVKAKESRFKDQYGTTVSRGLQMYPELSSKAPTWNDLKGVPANADVQKADENPF
jgi:hypothetical protein